MSLHFLCEEMQVGRHCRPAYWCPSFSPLLLRKTVGESGIMLIAGPTLERQLILLGASGIIASFRLLGGG
mgnify:CR=1 FL=1